LFLKRRSFEFRCGGAIIGHRIEKAILVGEEDIRWRWFECPRERSEQSIFIERFFGQNEENVNSIALIPLSFFP
jgi:hypothetical protein